MRKFARPVIVISKCIEFANCRYNGDIIHSIPAADLKKYVDYIPVCPEVEMGLGIPRNTLRIVEDGEGRRLMTNVSGEEVTDRIKKFSVEYLSGLNNKSIDAFLLKTSSPSCGYNDTKVYISMEKGQAVRKNSSGFFTENVEVMFPEALVETEGRIENFNIREDFYTKIFMAAEFREMSAELKIKDLIDFHSRNKYLLMCYSSGQLKKLGNIAANRSSEESIVVFEKYKTELAETLKKKRKIGTNINVMMHLMGYFSDRVTKEEKEFLMEKMEQYRNNMVPASVPISIIEGWVIRFGEEYLRNQTIFNPFPSELIKVTDSGKGRES